MSKIRIKLRDNHYALIDPPEIYPGLADPLPDPEQQPTPRGWAHRKDVMERHQAAFRQLLKTDFPPPEKAEGDGILTCGGGRWWPMIVVAVKMLREVSDLPVQIWHRGSAEPVNPGDLAGVPGVEIRDATKVTPRPRILRGWECKTVGLVHCGWRRVMFLDADAYCVADPAPLFDLASQQRVVFWSDLPHCGNNAKWHGWGLDPHKSQQVPSLQGGQLTMDRVAFWRELLLAHWLNQHSDYAYQYGYGDQDQWRIALAATGGSYLHLGMAPWRHPAFLYSVAGQVVVVHRCRGKLWGTWEDRVAAHLPKETRVWEYLRGLGSSGPADAASVFGAIYRRSEWGPNGSSGSGSSPVEAKPYLDLVNGLIRLSGWHRIVDLGCGDGWIAARLDAPEVVGVDCYGPHIDRLRREQPGRGWQQFDLDTGRDQLPAGEVALCKDVLHHWPTELIQDWIGWARTCGKWRWVILTQSRQQQYSDCPLGGYRGLDPDQEPLRSLGLTRLADYGQKSVLLLECRPVQ